MIAFRSTGMMYEVFRFVRLPANYKLSIVLLVHFLNEANISVGVKLSMNAFSSSLR